MSSKLDVIDEMTKKYADAYEALADEIRDLNSVIKIATDSRLKVIKRRVEAEAERRAELAVAIEAATDLFNSPRSLVLHGVKVGLAKGKGKIEMTDPDNTVRLIEKLMPDQVPLLVKIEKTPVKEALAGLKAAELKSLGVTVTGSGDEVVIRPVASNVDKMVKAFLKDSEEALKAA
jgi:hypothetical protein